MSLFYNIYSAPTDEEEETIYCVKSLSEIKYCANCNRRSGKRKTHARFELSRTVDKIRMIYIHEQSQRQSYAVRRFHSPTFSALFPCLGSAPNVE